MEIKKQSTFLRLFRRYGVLAFACVCCVAIALVLGLTTGAEKEEQEPVATRPISFTLPMQNAVVIKDYADDRLQFNDSLKRWEAHLSLDMTSESGEVFSVAEGVVTSVTSNSLDGYVVEISHDDGFVSVYSSLAADISVNVGDTLSAGQKIGAASSTAANEVNEGAHLHFTLLKDGTEVDPNNYLDLGNK